MRKIRARKRTERRAAGGRDSSSSAGGEVNEAEVAAVSKATAVAVAISSSSSGPASSSAPKTPPARPKPKLPIGLPPAHLRVGRLSPAIEARLLYDASAVLANHSAAAHTNGRMDLAASTCELAEAVKRHADAVASASG
eukprot:2140515-Alexandrium_andersonii.AAC.1